MKIFGPKKISAPTQHPSMLDIAWAAGVYEGEGYTDSGNHSIAIVQKDPEILHRLRNLFGGSVRSKSNGPTVPRIWVWYLGGCRARGFAMTIFSFLSKRRREQIKPLWRK